MRKRVVRALIFLVVVVAGAVGAASAAGAFDAPTSTVQYDDGVIWD
jgi:hypothetical protein